MVKVAVAIGLVFLIAALSVFGSPFFAVLLLIPAVIGFVALTGAAVVAEEAQDTSGDTAGSETKPGSRKTSEPSEQH